MKRTDALFRIEGNRPIEIKKLNARAAIIFRKLSNGLVNVGDHKKIDNASGAFMAICVEIIQDTKAGQIISVAHYYLQQGDMMRDPDCTFLVSDGGIFPLSYRQDNLGIDKEAAGVQADGHIVCYPKQQSEITKFCNQWMVNIAEQQGLDRKADARTWKCPECGHTEEITQDWLADHGEPVCGKCDCDMELQPV